MLSSPFHIHTIFKLAPVLCQKSEEIYFVSTSVALRQCGDPHFYFMILVRTVLPLNEKKIGINLFFSNFTKLYGLSYNGSNSACPN